MAAASDTAIAGLTKASGLQSRILPWVSALVSIGLLGLFWIEGARRAGWVLEYPLDDVYIHLAMASGIAGGTYGINPGESASAASSILFPFLLVPFPGTTLQWLLPAFWNGLAVLVLGALWGHAVALSRQPLWLALVLALGGPLLLNISGSGFVGMEHALHSVTAVLTILGLWVWVRDRRLAWWFVLALIAAPLLRLEGLALSLGAAGVVGLTGRLRLGIVLGLAALAPVALFMGFLTTLGLPPLPSSVLTKLGDGQASAGHLTSRIVANLRNMNGLTVAILVVILGIRAAFGRGNTGARLLLAAAAVAGAAHLFLGAFGWLGRYESYLLVMLPTALLVAGAAADNHQSDRLVPVTVLLAMAIGVLGVALPMQLAYLNNPNAIHLQQGQMARLSHDFLPVPVAVVDIGKVAWNAPAPVLDLYGLASDEARKLRQMGAAAPAGWAGPLADAKGVEYAMLPEGVASIKIPSDWQPLARFHTRIDGPVVLGPKVVVIYATGAGPVRKVASALRAFAASNPPADAGFELLPTAESDL